jgi:TonB system transport protein ExbD (group 1)
MAAKLAGPGGNSRYEMEANSDINVTPFVDVMLVLLIIFMVAAPLASVNVKVDMPNAVVKTVASTPPKPVYISIKPNGDIYVMNDKVTLADIGPELKANILGKRDPTKERIYIRADKNTQYGAFMDVMTTLQDNGYYSVALVGIDQNKGKGAGA